jgi:hypothetical protein
MFRLSEFIDWARNDLPTRFPNALLTICEPTSNPAAFVEIDTNSEISRMTFWNSGDIDIEILPLDQGTPSSLEHHQIIAKAQFLKIAESYFEKLGSLQG